ncbi:MAG: lasso peptide biosynthesis B2 protein [Pyrinomonadaceae bacterium]
MDWIAKFRGLSSSQRGLVITSAALLIVVRAGLRIFPYQKVHDRLDRLARRGSVPSVDPDPTADIATADNIAWAVTSAAARMPGTTCLPRALVGRYLLLRAGCPAIIRFGANKATDGAFAAHAWLESRDRVLLGGETRLDYTPLTAWPTDAA